MINAVLKHYKINKIELYLHVDTIQNTMVRKLGDCTDRVARRKNAFRLTTCTPQRIFIQKQLFKEVNALGWIFRLPPPDLHHHEAMSPSLHDVLLSADRPSLYFG